MFSHKRLATAFGLWVVASMIATACATTTPTPAPQVIIQTQIVAGTPQQIVVTATPAPPQPTQAVEFKSKDPTTFVEATFGDAQTLDPALDYETSGAQIIENTYDTLIFFKREDLNSFIPQLALEVPSKENGGITADDLTYTFNIRQGVKFHNGDEMTPGDVAYSLQRGVLQGGGSSPQWLMVGPLLGADYSDITQLVDASGGLVDKPADLVKANSKTLKNACQKVMDAVVADDAAGTVTVHLSQPWGPFLATLAQSWGSVQDKKWVMANGGWDGDCATWQNFYGKTSDEINKTKLGSGENGTGPFMLDHWTPTEEIVLKANENYWRTEPAWEGGPSGAPAIKTLIFKEVTEFSTRLAMMQAGDADGLILGSSEQYPEVDPLVGEICDSQGNCQPSDNPTSPLRVHKGLSNVGRDDVFFTFKVNTDGGNNFIGSGQLDGNGIPPDFFKDLHVRKAFAYCFDWETYIKDVQQGEGIQSYDVMLPGMIGYEDNGAHYSYDPKKCEEEFKASTWKSKDGQSLWDVGFRFTVAFNTGSTERQTVAQIFQQNVAAVNDKFLIETVGLPWPTFLNEIFASKFPIFVIGWLEDIPDPHNWAVPYTLGTFGGFQSFPDDLKAQFKDITSRAVAEADPAKRATIYHELNQVFYDQVPDVLLAVQLNRRYEQRWVQGWYSNPIYPGTPGTYFYTLSEK